jgi:hypothetical protein
MLVPLEVLVVLSVLYIEPQHVDLELVLREIVISIDYCLGWNFVPLREMET